MTVEPPQRRQPRAPSGTRPGRSRTNAPLYDAAFEHDACGIGFVADAGGGKRDVVLPLALGGLAALAHRGAFGADGASSDGAGVSLPLDASAPRGPRARPDVGRRAAGRPPAVPAADRPRGTGWCRPPARGGCHPRVGPRGHRVAHGPADPGSLGAAARAVRPAFVQVFVHRPPGRGRSRLPVGRGLRGGGSSFSAAGSRPRPGRRASARWSRCRRPRAGRSSTRAWSRARGSASCTRTCGLRSIRVPYAMFHQRYATNTQPTWRLAQPFRTIAHNGEINTVRGNRAQVRGRVADQLAAASGVARELIEAGPLLGGRRLRLAVARRGARAARCDGLGSRGGAPDRDARGTGPAAIAASARGRAPSADRRLPRAVGRPRGDRLRRRPAGRGDRRPQRAPSASFAVTRDRLVAVASEAGAIPLRPEETVRRGRLGPGELFLVDPGRGLILEDAEAKAHLLRRLTIHDAPRPTHADPVPGTRSRRWWPAPRAPRRTTTPTTPSDLRFLAGLHAENARLDIRTMALEAHEPLWSMGDDTPTPALGRLDRPIADHLRQSFAQVTNPPIDPERERAVMDLRVELGRRSSLLGGPPRASRTLRLERPFLADLPGAPPRVPADPVRRLDATWPAIDGAAGLARALDRLAAEAVAAARGRIELLVLSDRAYGADRLPVPSILAAGAVHTALTEAGLRGRTDLVVEAADILDVHGAAMALATGATAVVPWLAVELAAELAGGARRRGAGRRGDRRQPASTRSTPASARRSPGWGSARPPRTSAAELFEIDRAGARRPRPLLPGGAGVAGPDRARRARGAAAPAARGRIAGDRVRHAVQQAPGSRLRPVPRRRRDASLRAGDRRPRSSSPSGFADVAGRRDRAPTRSTRGPRSSATSSGSAGRAATPRSRSARSSPRARSPGGSSSRDVRRRALARGAPGADDRHPAGRRRREHRRGRRGPRLVRAGSGRRAPRRAGSSRSRRPGSASPPPTSPGASSSRSRSPRARSPARAASSPRRRRRPGSPSLRRGQPGHELHQPAAAPRHLLDRGPRPADRRPPGDQPVRPDRREARREPRRRDDRRRRRQGRRDVRPSVGSRRRDGRLAAARASSTSGRRGSSVSPRSTRRCSGTGCATASPSGRTAGCGPAATC